MDTTPPATPPRVYKIVVSGPAQATATAAVASLASGAIISSYKGFLVARALASEIRELSGRYPVVDITDQYDLKLPSEPVTPSITGLAMAEGARPRAEGVEPGRHHYVVQFVGPLKAEWLAGVRSAGGQPRTPYQGFSYIVRLDPKSLEAVSKLPFVRWVGRLPGRARLSAGVRAEIDTGKTSEGPSRTRRLADTYVVGFFDEKDAADAVLAIQNLGFEILGDSSYTRILILGTSEALSRDSMERAARLQQLSLVHGVQRISHYAIQRTSNDVAAGIMGTARALAKTDLALSGKGEIVGICDTGLDSGDPASIHPDFRGRVRAIKSYPMTPYYSRFVLNPGADDGPADLGGGHGTHVAGSVVGDGSASPAVPPIRGLAFEAELVFQAVEQRMQWNDFTYLGHYGPLILAGLPADLDDLFQYAYDQGVRIHSNSWGGGNSGAYNEQARGVDAFAAAHPDFCILFAAGNDGTDKDADGIPDLGSVAPPGTAKNCITVGACESVRPEFNDAYGAPQWWPDSYPVDPLKSDNIAGNPDEVAAFSSRGPTADGRVKPDVLAPGTFILSTRSTQLAENVFSWRKYPASKLYLFNGGTSMATPLAAGAAALIRQHLRKNIGIPSPTSALLKAAMIAGAKRLAGAAGRLYDMNMGFGRVNVDAIVSPPPPAKAGFFESPSGLETGDSGTIRIEVRSSAPLRCVLVYTDPPGDHLVNDLNLIVKAPDATQWYGNQVPGGPPYLDSRNNVEVVEIPEPTPGTYEVQVVASNVSEGPQRYAIVWVADAEEVQ
jgi:subtilisin family serine protease